MSKEKFSAVIKIGAELGSSVKSAFGSAKTEAEKMGAAINALYEKQKRVESARRTIGGARETKGKLERLYAARATAKIESAKSYAGKTEAANLKRLNQEIARTEKLFKKEQAAALEAGSALRKAGIDTKNLGKESQRLGSEIERLERKMQSGERWGKVRKNFLMVGAAATAATTAIIGTAFALAKSRTGTAKELLAFSKGIGMDVVALQNFMRIGKKVGVEGTVIEGFLTKVNANVEKARNPKSGKQMRDAFHQMGLGVEYLSKLSPEDKLIAIANAGKHFKGTEAQWAALAGKAFGRANVDVVKFLGALQIPVWVCGNPRS